jgi:ABC-type sugar transport system ATPase subunit
VANLLGEPPTNLIEGILKAKEGQYFFQVGNVSISLSKSLADELLSKINQEKLIIGIRPFDLHCYLKQKENAKILNIEVYMSEILGHYNIISIKLGNTVIKIREDKSFKVSLGEKISVDFKEEKLDFFNAISGNRIF